MQTRLICSIRLAVVLTCCLLGLLGSIAVETPGERKSHRPSRPTLPTRPPRLFAPDVLVVLLELVRRLVLVVGRRSGVVVDLEGLEQLIAPVLVNRHLVGYQHP